LNQGTNFSELRFKIPELDTAALSAPPKPQEKKEEKKDKKDEKPAK
jgi:hypothetical protein